MAEDNKSIRIGDILVGAGILSSEILDSRVDVARLLSQPLGQTLVQFGDVTNYQLISAVQLQSLCLDGVLPLDVAVEAMGLVRNSDCYLEAALEKVGFIDSNAGTTRLGELLVDAELVNQDQMTMALDIAFRECTPLGQVLFHLGLISPAIIVKSLAAQKRVRSGQLTRAEAVLELAALAKEASSVLEI